MANRARSSSSISPRSGRGSGRATGAAQRLDDGLSAAFAEALARRCSVREGQKVLIAVSGGADSLALLHLLLDFRRGRGWPDLHVAHLDHSARGAAGRRDAGAVKRLCRALGVACAAEALPPWPAPPSEDALRRARHAHLQRVAREVGAHWIALGHHRRDQAETVLWHLSRGSGRRGLGGMRHVSGQRIRPLLELDPGQLRAYLRRRRVRWSEDETNRSSAWTRNRVRALIPALERAVHPAAERNLARAAGILAAEDEWLESLALRRLRDLSARAGKGLVLQAAALRGDPLPLRRRILRLAVRRVSERGLALSLARTERLEGLLAQRRGRLDLGGGIRAERAGQLLLLARVSAAGLDATACRSKICGRTAAPPSVPPAGVRRPGPGKAPGRGGERNSLAGAGKTG